MEKEFDFEIWRDAFIGNYEGKTDEAKALEPLLKRNYKDNVYVPWATLERLANLQDPNFNVTVSRSGDYNDGILFTNKYELYQRMEKATNLETTNIYKVSPMIHLVGTFLGKTMEEWYPVQDNSYDAPQAVDQNMVNKAIQRGKTRLTSRLTGLALSLYENGELQFDNPEKPKTIMEQAKEQKVVKENVVVEQPSKPEQTNTTKTVESEELLSYAKELKDNPAFIPVLQKFNASIVKQLGATINLEKDSVEEIAALLGKMKNASVFMNAVRKQIEG